MHKGAGLLTQMQFDTLVQFGRDLQSQIPKPDLIVFVNADRDVLLRRIQGSGAPAPVVANPLPSSWRSPDTLKRQSLK